MSTLQTHTHTHALTHAWNNTNTQASCSDMLRMLALYFSSSQRPGQNPAEGRRRQQSIINKHTNVPDSAVNLLFFQLCCKCSRVLGCSLKQQQAGKKKARTIPICFHHPDMNYSPEPSERFRRKYFLWMCLRESEGCRQKTKPGAIVFPTFHSLLVFEHAREAHVCVCAR